MSSISDYEDEYMVFNTLFFSFIFLIYLRNYFINYSMKTILNSAIP